MFPLKIGIGIAIGMLAGFGYHKLMIDCKSQCVNARFPMVPVTVLGVIGAVVASKIK
jgi:disulfide bond formation protein DsbB